MITYLVDEKLLDAGRRLRAGQSLGHVLEEEVRVEGDHLVEAEQRVHLPRGRPARSEEHHGEGRRHREGAEDEALGTAALEEVVVQPEGEVVVDLHEEPLGAAHLRHGRRQTLVVLGDGGKLGRRPVIVVALVVAVVPFMVTMMLPLMVMVTIVLVVVVMVAVMALVM